MVKNILGVILGYIIMFAVVFVGLTIAWMALGADGAFAEGSYDPSMLWNLLMVAVGLVAAIAGGLICQKITKSGGAIKALVVVILVLGGLSAVFSLMGGEDPGPREGDVSMTDAMTKAQQPVWVAIANPLIGAVGVMIGAGLAGGKKEGAAPSGDESG